VTEKSYVHLLEGLISMMSQNENQVIRDSAFRTLETTLSIFDEMGRFTVLKDLHSRCPFSSAKSILIHCIKENINQSWNQEVPSF